MDSNPVTVKMSLRQQVKALHALLREREWMLRPGVTTSDDAFIHQCIFCSAMISVVRKNGLTARPLHQPDCQMAALVHLPRARVFMTAVQRYQPEQHIDIAGAPQAVSTSLELQED